MKRSFKIGDSVMLVDDRTKGKIMFVSERKVRVMDVNGFEYLLPHNKVILLDEKTDKITSYGNTFLVKEEDIKKSDQSSKLFSNNKSDKGCLKIDLHIENLSDYYHKMNNFEIVQIQLDHCKKHIEIAIDKHLSKIVIIHGIGEGVLKKEVHSLLSLYNLKFFESNNGGSTEVIL